MAEPRWARLGLAKLGGDRTEKGWHMAAVERPEGGAHRRAGGSRVGRWPKIVIGVVVVLLLAALAASLISIPYYAITPGEAVAVNSVLSVPGAVARSHRGRVLFVYVELTPLRAIEYPYFALDSSATLYKSQSILGLASAHQYQLEGEIDMADAHEAATYVGLRELGYRVDASPDGARIYLVEQGSPAEGVLRVGDVVTSVEGRPTPTTLALARAIEVHTPGTRLRLTYRGYLSASTRHVAITLGEFYVLGSGASRTYACLSLRAGRHDRPYYLKDGKVLSCAGVESVADYLLSDLPFPVSFATGGIVGPSAGLAFTLGLIDRLDPANLTNGLVVAATGTMSISGAVGPIGGVTQKTIAVRRAGGQVFFVPKAEYAKARAAAGPHLRIFGVNSITEVLADLRSIGGRIVVHRRAAAAT